MDKFSSIEQATDYDTTRNTPFSFWLTETTNTHSEYVILIFSVGNIIYTKALPYYVYTYIAVHYKKDQTYNSLVTQLKWNISITPDDIVPGSLIIADIKENCYFFTYDKYGRSH